MDMRPRLLVVGGGYVGCDIARRLENELDVTLIEPKTAFVHTPAMIRALVRPDLRDRAIMPYDRLLGRGRVIRARVSAIEPDGVSLDNGETVPGDMIVVATGSDHAGFLKPSGDSIDDFRAIQADAANRIASARHIAIAGAGSVGIELAGEIASALPGIRITLISTSPGLMPGHHPRLGRMLRRKLAAQGVAIITAHAELPPGESIFDGPLHLDNGERVEADLVLAATGSQGRNGLLTALPDVRAIADGRVATDPWLRPSSHPRIFVGGDVAATGDAMTIVATMRQIPFLIKALRCVASGGDIHHLRPYSPWSAAPILLPLGPERGASFLPAPGPLAPLGVVGDFITRQMKGADLFIPKYRRLLGLTDTVEKAV